VGPRASLDIQETRKNLLPLQELQPHITQFVAEAQYQLCWLTYVTISILLYLNFNGDPSHYTMYNNVYLHTTEQHSGISYWWVMHAPFYQFYLRLMMCPKK